MGTGGEGKEVEVRKPPRQKCPRCLGKRKLAGIGTLWNPYPMVDCYYCKGKGKL